MLKNTPSLKRRRKVSCFSSKLPLFALFYSKILFFCQKTFFIVQIRASKSLKTRWQYLYLRKNMANMKFLFKILPPLSIFLLFSCGTAKKEINTPTNTLRWIGAKDSLRVGFYNIENLFDTIDDPQTSDSDFLPNAPMQWNAERYAKKQADMAKVIAAMNPSVIGLAEVENKAVLEYLVAQSSLKASNYGIVHFDSPDERGIDVALLYKKADFKVKNSKSHRITFTDAPADRTRDILEVNGILRGGSEVTFFVNHWPSRRGGAEESEAKRVFVAQKLRQLTDSIFAKNAKANIVAVGDLNDEPYNKSLLTGLGAVSYATDSIVSSRQNVLYNMGAPIKRSGKGTSWYKGWSVIDQILVSGSFISSQNKIVSADSQVVFKESYMLFTDRASGEGLPSRTYTGEKYRGGFSDHFPIYIQLYLK